MTSAQKKALVAGGLSLAVPGLGHIVHRAYVVGLAWMVIAASFWWARPQLAFTVNVIAAVFAYWNVERNYAAAKRRRKA